MKYQNILNAPAKYWHLSPEKKKAICNGVGPKGLGWIFPETIWGLCVTEAADIHDYQYHVGVTVSQKMEADTNFYDNMCQIIEQETSWNWLKKLRLHRAGVMYAAVDKLGMSAYLSKG